MVRWVFFGVLCAALTAVVGCGGDDDAPGGRGTPTSAVVTSPGATAPGDDEAAILEYSFKVIDWGERLRVASLAIAEQIGLYGQDIAALEEQPRRDAMYAAFETIADVRAEYSETIPPPSLADDHQRLGESLASFADAQQSVTLAYAAWDSGKTDAVSLQLGAAVDAMNNASMTLNQVISDVSNPQQ